eukprot:TRINITY_DN5596_c0_g1_i1.p2 TRINITY_DN5596_c0_g1~~TRINITY_DN5596_c0_g1_i1.p2  ORF type:complete len:296 (+),score=73.99 TRINITY_DN5596_c0_g1_i1:1990-2877(+)
MLVKKILDDPREFNLKGFAVGDGCMGTDVLCGDSDGPYWQVEFMHGHGQFSNKLYKEINKVCSVYELKHNNLSAACIRKLTQMYAEIGGYYGYNLYDDCIGRNIFMKHGERNWWGANYGKIVEQIQRSTGDFGGALNDYPCPGSAMGIWLNLSSVRQALNVPINSNFFSGDNGVGFNYTSTERNLLPFYESIVKFTNLRVLVYNGDTDPGINSFITQDKYFDFFDSVGIPQSSEWRPWTLDGKIRMGGYVTKYGSNFAYLTIRGSGHMVPEFKPAASAAFLSNWLSGKDFPRYNP